VRGFCPRYVARLLALSLPLGVMLPGPVGTAAAQSKTTAAKPAPKAAAKPAYSPSAAAARKARLERARAAAAAREQERLRAERALREAMTPRYKTDASGALVPDIRAAAAIIFNPVTGEVLWEENAKDKRSIASITKVMTAVVVLENDPDLSRRVVIDRSDVLAASVTYLRAGDRISLDHLLHLTLIASDNGAARALARTSSGGSRGFIQRMNQKAIELGLESTTFTDPSGLNPANISSAYDLSRLITFASHDDRIAAIMRLATFTVSTQNRSFAIRNTNHLVRGGEVDVLGGKTGFISKAGYCLATLLRLPQSQHQVAVVVLGAGSNNGRFWETRHLFNWLSDRATDMFASASLELEYE
jgi:serine-type D-Ala-D-Ala endopeptidase (penicillin-binding protein 7)